MITIYDRAGKLTRRLIGSTVVAAALATAGPAAADTTLNPPPPDFYTCQTNGSGTVCHGQHSTSYQGGYDGTCPQGFDILENGFVQETAERYYDRDGNLVRRVRHDRWPVTAENILYNSVTGKSVEYLTDITETDILAVPGDLGSATATFTGVGYVATAARGLLAHDSGIDVFSPDGDLIDSHGPHTLFSGQIDKLCAALA